MKKTKKLVTVFTVFVVIILIGIFTFNYVFGFHKVKIDDAINKHNFSLSKPVGLKLGVVRMRIKVIGYIDGDAIITVGYKDSEQQSIKINRGIVHIERGYTWYVNSCTLNYKPLNVKSGKLTIYYKFATH